MVLVGPVIGQGSQAKVYFGVYLGGPIAVKVVTAGDCMSGLRELAAEVRADFAAHMLALYKGNI